MIDFKVNEQPAKVVATSPLDMVKVKKAFEPYRQKIDEMMKHAEWLEIKTDADIQHATIIAGEARRLSKLIEETKLANTKDAREFVFGANGLAKMFTDPLEKVVKILRKKGEEFSFQKIVEQRKRESEERDRVAKLQAEVDKKAEEAGVESVTLPPPAVREFSGVTRTDTGSSLHVKLVWKGIITDIKAVPREYCEPSQKLVDEAVKAGIREIPGVKIEEVPESRLRA